MRTDYDQSIALECLKLALANFDNLTGAPIDNAECLLAFVTGTDVDIAKAKLAAVREAAA